MHRIRATYCPIRSEVDLDRSTYRMHTPYFTMHRARTSYAHLMPEEESNLSLAEFGVGVDEKRAAGSPLVTVLYMPKCLEWPCPVQAKEGGQGLLKAVRGPSG